MRSRLHALLAVAALAHGTVARAAEPWPEVPPPPRASVQWVGDSMRINGIPTRIQRFDSPVTREEVVEFYRAHWTVAGQPKPAVNDVDDAVVVGQAHGPYFMTLKVRRQGAGSEGILAVQRVLGHEMRLDPGEVTLMPNAKVVSVVESDDPGRTSRQVVAVNEASVESVRAFYDTTLRQRGWKFIQQGGPLASASSAYPATTPQNVARGWFAIYQRDLKELQVSIVPGSSTTGNRAVVVANLVARDTAPGLTR